MAGGFLKSRGPSLELVKEVPHSTPCPGCSGPLEASDAFCPACGAKNAGVANLEAAAAPASGFRCEGCGAEVRCEPNSRSTTCPFCAAPYVLELPSGRTGRQDPEFVVGFEVPRERADLIFRQWLGGGGVFRPRDLGLAAGAERLKGIYLPFWSFSVKADSRWRANIGEYWYRTETYIEKDANGNPVTRTRQIRETEWWPLEGAHHAYYSFYLVSGSKGLAQSISEWILPYQLGALKRFSAGFLAGWLSEEYSVEKDAAYRLSEEEFQRREQAAVAGFLPGDAHAGLVVETEFSNVNSDLILLPLYLQTYRYRNKLYRILINGQTGKIAGEKPVSVPRVLLAVLIAILFAVGVYLVISGFVR